MVLLVYWTGTHGPSRDAREARTWPRPLRDEVLGFRTAGMSSPHWTTSQGMAKNVGHWSSRCIDHKRGFVAEAQAVWLPLGRFLSRTVLPEET